MRKIYIILYIFLVLPVIFLASKTNILAALTYGSGIYTNLCGSGTDASFHNCSGACSTENGSCATNGPFVVRFTCNGSVTDCRENEQPFSNSYSLDRAACNTTVQIDVFDQNCRASGGWDCGDGSLKDYLVWYSGSCGVVHLPPPTPTPIPTPKLPTPTITPTPTVLVAPTLTPIPTPLPTLTPAPTATSTVMPTPTEGPGRGGGGESGPVSAPVAMFSRCDSLVASSNNTVAPSDVIFNVKWTETKNGVNRYRFWFGDGTNKETDVPVILHRYLNPGKYHASVEIRDSEGNWKSSDACATDIVLSALRRPAVLPATGAPISFSLLGLLGGALGFGLLFKKR